MNPTFNGYWLALLDTGKPERIDGAASVSSEHDQPFNRIRMW
ncbi:MAG TPA: hypothetical protein VGJ72_01850 [Polaromonas sp.]|nr:hypothetical protein [Lysobacter sp.]